MSAGLMKAASADDPLVCVRSHFWNFNAVGLAGDGACVVDPGIDPDEIALLRDGGAFAFQERIHEPGSQVVMPRQAAQKSPHSQERILASKQWLDERLDVDDPQFSYPRADQVFEDSKRLTCAGLEVELLFVPGHSDCTSVVWIPELSTLLTADYLVEPGLPYCRWQAGPFERALDTLIDLVERESVQRVIPSHNDWIEGNEAILAALRTEQEYFALLRDAVRSACESGLAREQCEREGVKAVRSWRAERGQDVGKRERQDLDNVRRLTDEEHPSAQQA